MQRDLERLVDALRAICPQRIRGPGDLRQYNIVQARLEGLSLGQIAREQRCAKSTVAYRVRKAMTDAPAMADILRQPRSRWIVAT